MLDVFHHAGFPVTSAFEYGTVTLRFPIEDNETYHAALADREAARRPPNESPTSLCGTAAT
jgi:hypothetical protein